MNIELTTITPPMASVMLANNSSNRKLNLRHVDFLSQQMLSGKWQNNGQTIVVADDGTLMDGQHRLSAIIKANKPTQIGLCTGAPKTAMATIDNGKTRSSYDVLSMNQIPNAALIGSAIAILYKWDLRQIMNDSGARQALPNALIMPTLQEMQEAVDMDVIVRVSKTTARNTRMKPSSVFAAFYLIAVKYGSAVLEEFADRINNGGDYKKSPTTTMAQIIARHDVLGKQKHRSFDFGLLLGGFERWLKRQTMSRYTMTSLESDLKRSLNNYVTNLTW